MENYRRRNIEQSDFRNTETEKALQLAERIRYGQGNDPRRYWARIFAEERAQEKIDRREREVKDRINELSEDDRRLATPNGNPLPQTNEEVRATHAYYTMDYNFRSQMNTVRNRINKLILKMSDEQYQRYGPRFVFFRDLVPDNYANDDLAKAITTLCNRVPIELIQLADIVFQTIDDANQNNYDPSGDH